MWIPDVDIKEYNITLSPWSSTLNRTITWDSQLRISNGLCAKDNNTLITTTNTFSPQRILSLDISGSTAVETIIGYLPTNMVVAGDIIYTTTNKLIITALQNVGYFGTFILQYDFATMALELQVEITAYTIQPFGLLEFNDKLFVLAQNGDVYDVALTAPYALTLTQNTGLTTTSGASQTPSCCNVNLIP